MKEYRKEAELLKGLAENSYQTIEKIYKDNFSTVQSLVINNNGSYDDAKDVFQEAMVVLYEKSLDPKFELSCQLKTFIYSISRRLWLKKLQQQNRFVVQIEPHSELVAVDDEIAMKQQMDFEFEKMASALQLLGEPCRSLIEAFYVHKKPMTEIANDFGYTNADNAKNQKYKCLIRLKKLFFSASKS